MLTTPINITKAEVAFVSDNYNWESYSIVRSLFEELGRVECLQVTDAITGSSDLILLIGANSYPVSLHIPPTVRIGLSDPNLFSEKMMNECDLYITNSLDISKKYGCPWLPVFSDKRYFKPMPVKKETDILFIGGKDHPYVVDREKWVNDLIRLGFKVKCFGHGWENGFIKGERLVEEINKAHLYLDLTNDVTVLSSRIFQASMCGVPVMTKIRPDIEQLLPNEYIGYNDYHHLKHMLEGCMSKKTVLPELGEIARQKCIAEHDVGIRVHQLMEILNDKGLLRSLQE